MRKAVTVSIIVAFVIASAAVYGLFNLNSAIQAKPEQSPNYSVIGSLQPQISSINNSVSSLGTLKTDISDIRGKLSDLETKVTQAQQAATLSSTPVAVLDSSSYFQGDTVYIVAAGFEPQKIVQIQLIDSGGSVLTQTQTQSDSSGKVTYDFSLPRTTAFGNYKIRIISDQLSVSQPITITGSLGSVTSIYPLTAKLDRTIYLKGDQVLVSGIGKPVSIVNAVFTSPSGKAYVTSTTTSSNGSYQLSFVTAFSFETGYWSVNVTNEGQSKGAYSFYMASDGSTSSGTFTTHTDKMFYVRGDVIQISGMGAAFTPVNVVLTSPSGKIYAASTNTGLDGSYQLTFSSDSYETGFWDLNVTNQGNGKEFSFYVASKTSSSNSFTAQTDKTIYLKGNPIHISGISSPYTTVDAILKSPSGVRYETTFATSSDGSYAISFPTLASYETGNWLIAITDGSVTKVISIFLEP